MTSIRRSTPRFAFMSRRTANFGARIPTVSTATDTHSRSLAKAMVWVLVLQSGRCTAVSINYKEITTLSISIFGGFSPNLTEASH